MAQEKCSCEQRVFCACSLLLKNREGTKRERERKREKEREREDKKKR